MNLLTGLSFVQYWIALVLGLAMLACEVVAFVDCLRHREDAFRAAGKLTKNKWLLITGIALLLGILTVQSPIGFLGIIAIVGSAVYLVDVRPALRQVLGKARQSTHQGPYGPW